MFSKKTYDRSLKYLWPAVESYYKEDQHVILQFVKENSPNGVNLAGDGRYDSRGYSALFCSYSFLDTSTNLIIKTDVKEKKEQSLY